MSVRLYADGFRCAIYEEAPGGGDPIDPLSQMNRPVVNPLGWLSNIYFHSDLDYYRIAAIAPSVTISHAAVPTITRPAAGGSGEVSTPVSLVGQFVRTTHLLLTHNLGYVPRFFCLYNGNLVPQGIPVQFPDTARWRAVTAYATSTEIRLFEIGVSSSSDLPAASLNYQVVVFHAPGSNPLAKMLDISPGEVVFGQGKFIASEPHLRADGVGDIQWPIATRRTSGIRNGGVKAYYPDGTSATLGSYNGSLPAPTFLTTSAGV